MNTLLRPFHVAVIDPGSRVPELDNYNRLVLGCPEVRFSYHLPALFGMSSLQFLVQKADALIIFGSAASVYDQLPWQAPLHTWIKSQVDSGLPTLGICYGHQLLAHLYGGTIEFAVPSQEKYKGLRTIDFLKKGFWAGDEGRYIVSHRELIATLPACFDTAGSSLLVKHELIQHRTLPTWGIQSHPEAGPEFVLNSAIPLTEGDPQPFASGQDFMRRFVLHLIQQRIQ
ncbi:MAG: gamma-glutamyl-gamma-aminobutyrate hydrolase family protein [Chitinophagaceae bacterium]|nr:gamma-glutamyl-gamma-aminobutyrate hydrolase family protein [Oligoflexus sp.]